MALINLGGRAVLETCYWYTDPSDGWRTAREIAAGLKSDAPRARRVALVIPEADDPDRRLEARGLGWRLEYLMYPTTVRVFSSLVEAKGTRPDAAVIGSLDVLRTRHHTRVTLRQREAYGGHVAADAASRHPARSFVMVVVALIVLCALGYPLVRLGSTEHEPWPVVLAASHLGGAAVLTTLEEWSAILLGRLAVWPVYTVAALAGGVALARWRRSVRPAAHAPETNPQQTASLLPAVLAWVLIAGSIVYGLWLCTQRELGWDGWAIWQYKAKALFYDGNLNMLAYPAEHVSHPDYPLLVPMHTWWLYLHHGQPWDRLAQLGGLLFCLDLAAIVYAVARLRSNAPTALLAAGLVAAQPKMLVGAATGYADTAFAAAVCGAIGYFAWTWPQTSHGRSWLLPAVFLAAAMHTKNEGTSLWTLLVIMAMAYTLAIEPVWDRLRAGRRARADAAGQEGARVEERLSRRIRAARASAIVCAALALALPWLLLTQRARVQSDLVTGRYEVVDALPPGSKLGPGPGTEERVPIILRELVRNLSAVGPHMPAFGLVWLLAIVALPRWNNDRSLMTLKAVAALHFLGYLVVYLATPHPVDWHLATSFSRLMTHILPAAVVAWTWTVGSEPCGVVNEAALQS